MCWGSFLNVAAYRLIRGDSFIYGRSACPKCKSLIAWYDNIPIISWLILLSKCRACNQSISALYPFIELLTAATLACIFLRVPINYFAAYFFFASALIVTIRSDLETMLISRYVTIFLIPVAPLLSLSGLLPITPAESMLGALTGYFFLYFTSKAFTFFTGKNGIGQGDLDLLSFIGAFTGIVGWWSSILIGSIGGSIIGIIYLLVAQPSQPTKIPFGPFLASGAILFILFERPLTHLLLGI